MTTLPLPLRPPLLESLVETEIQDFIVIKLVSWVFGLFRKQLIKGGDLILQFLMVDMTGLDILGSVLLIEDQSLFGHWLRGRGLMVLILPANLIPIDLVTTHERPTSFDMASSL